jgi:protein involved in polysaccharide export with SLBB domain
VSSLSTLVNAVFSAGGPSTRGSMRHIQLKRGASVVTELDMYDLIALGDKSKDAPLLPGDVIYFPPIGPLVALAGSVNNPAIFELKGATNIGQLIDLAGGLTTTAQTRKAAIERIDERQTRTVDQFSLDYDGLHRPLKDGDLVAVFSISPRFENAVTLRGKVAAPLRYPYKPGMRIRDLIPERDTRLLHAQEPLRPLRPRRARQARLRRAPPRRRNQLGLRRHRAPREERAHDDAHPLQPGQGAPRRRRLTKPATRTR